MNDELQSLRTELDRLTDNIMPFGTFRGVRITDVVRMHRPYLVWVLKTVPLQPTLRENIARVLREYRPRRVRPGDPPPARVQEKPMEPAANLGKTHLRVARPTDSMSEVVRFYRDGLGFALVGEFTNHDGFDGVMLGHAGCGYHLEFTRKRGHEAGRAPTDDHLLVFYLPDREEWERAVRRMEAHGFHPVEPFNPYWKKCGATFADPDGYRVVLQNAAWPTRPTTQTRDGDQQPT